MQVSTGDTRNMNTFFTSNKTTNLLVRVVRVSIAII